ncbi:MAG TPA: FAD-dependent oxidoreductase [Reyranella sp.]|jgi:monoamine oxidase|nr:FAD-dependent oxidoreductase [Reyranella sp.]
MRRRRFLASVGAVGIAVPAWAAETDVAVIGAGVAGMAAAGAVLKAGRSVVVLEARDRVGGRVFADKSLGFVFDHGAPIDASAGRAAAIIVNGKELTREGYAQFDKLQAEYETKIELVRKLRPGIDPGKILVPSEPLDKLALGELLRRKPAWPPITVSVDAKPGPHVKLNSRVVRLDTTEELIRIVSPAGEYAARSAIVTVPVSVLGDLSFAPPLSAKKKAAIGAVSMAPFDKVAIAFSRKVFDAPADARILALAGKDQVVEALLRPHGHEAAIVFFSRDDATALEAAGPSAADATALSLLADIFGKELRSAFAGGRSTRWSRDRFAKGAWPMASSEQCAVFAAPHQQRVFFAGDATVANGGVMGAHESGLRAAREALAVLGHK